MKAWSVVLPLCLLASTLLIGNGCVVASPGPPPPAQVEVYGPSPYVGAVWVPGAWTWHEHHRRWEWHRGYWR